MPKPVVKSLVIVGISGPILEEFTAVENQNFGEGVELNSRRNQQKTRWYRGTIQSWETGKGKSLELNKKEKNIKRNEVNLKDLGSNIKGTDIHIIGV